MIERLFVIRLKEYLNEQKLLEEIENDRKHSITRIKHYGEALKKFRFFLEDNKIHGSQDMGGVFWNSLPSNIEFEIDNINNKSCFIRGWGYGILNKKDDSYGNGAIAIKLEDLYKYFTNKSNKKRNEKIKILLNSLEIELKPISQGDKMVRRLKEIREILDFHLGD